MTTATGKFNVLCHTNDPEWKDLRRTGLTATDSAKIIGMSDYGTQIDVFLEKIGGAPEVEENDAMYWGHRHEPTIISELPLRRSEVVEAFESGWLLSSTENSIHLATLDGYGVLKDSGEFCVIEAKTSARANRWADGPPDEYVIQLQKQLAVTGWNVGYLCALIGGSDYRVWRFERDQELINYIIREEVKFWNENVIPSKLPQISPLDAKSAQKLYPEAIEDTVILPGDISNICQVALRARALEKLAKQAKDWADGRLKLSLGNYKNGVVGEYKLAWGNVSTTSFDSKRFKAEHPDLYDTYLKSNSHRRFTIKEKTDGKDDGRTQEQITRNAAKWLGVPEGDVLRIEGQSDVEEAGPRED